MARTDRNAALGEALTAEETSLMDADRDSEASQPAPEPELAPAEVEPPAPEIEAEAEDAPEPAEPEIDPATGKQRKVDYGAFHSERERRKAADAKTQATEKQLATLMGRFDVLQQLAQKSQEPKPQAEAPIEIPDINIDPVGHFQAKDAIRERELTELRAWRTGQEHQSQVRNNVARIQELAQSHEAEFSKTHADYGDAFQFLRQNRDAELQAMGYTDPIARQQIISNDAIQIAAQALQTNKNAAEAVYNIAKARGWAAKAPAKEVVPPPKPEEHPDSMKLAQVAKGQKANQSLGQGNGSAPPVSTPQMIANMSDAEFSKWATDDNWRKLMGG